MLGVIASLPFVGVRIHESNRQARAAHQPIGIATSGFHRSFDARLNRLVTQSAVPEAVQRWSLATGRLERIVTADLRMLETVLLQVDQGSGRDGQTIRAQAFCVTAADVAPSALPGSGNSVLSSGREP